MLRPDPLLYWLEELFGNLIGQGSYLALNGNKFDIYDLPSNLQPMCGTVLETTVDDSGVGSVTNYKLQLDDTAIAEFQVARPAPDAEKQKSLVRGVISFMWPKRN